jgi:hypothetical protein
MRKPSVKDFTFTNQVNLFGSPVTMVLRNKDKKHILSLGNEHFDHMATEGLNYENKDHILIYLQEHNYL